MKKVDNNAITTFECEVKVMVDIIENESGFEAWIYDKDYGIKELMFGVPKNNMENGKPFTETFDGFKELVKANIDNYIHCYYETVNKL